jgi:hypothetical protein
MSGQALPSSGFVGGQVPKPPPAPPVPVPVAPPAPPEPALVLLDAPAEPEVDALLDVALVDPRPALPAEPPVDESSPPQCAAAAVKKQKKMAKMGFFMGTPYFSSQTAREA